MKKQILMVQKPLMMSGKDEDQKTTTQRRKLVTMEVWSIHQVLKKSSNMILILKWTDVIVLLCGLLFKPVVDLF